MKGLRYSVAIVSLSLLLLFWAYAVSLPFLSEKAIKHTLTDRSTSISWFAWPTTSHLPFIHANINIDRINGGLSHEEARLKREQAYIYEVQVAPWDYLNWVQLAVYYTAYRQPEKAKEVLEYAHKAAGKYPPALKDIMAQALLLKQADVAIRAGRDWMKIISAEVHIRNPQTYQVYQGFTHILSPEQVLMQVIPYYGDDEADNVQTRKKILRDLLMLARKEGETEYLEIANAIFMTESEAMLTEILLYGSVFQRDENLTLYSELLEKLGYSTAYYGGDYTVTFDPENKEMACDVLQPRQGVSFIGFENNGLGFSVRIEPAFKDVELVFQCKFPIDIRRETDLEIVIDAQTNGQPKQTSRFAEVIYQGVPLSIDGHYIVRQRLSADSAEPLILRKKVNQRAKLAHLKFGLTFTLEGREREEPMIFTINQLSLDEVY